MTVRSTLMRSPLSFLRISVMTFTCCRTHLPQKQAAPRALRVVPHAPVPSPAVLQPISHAASPPAASHPRGSTSPCTRHLFCCRGGDVQGVQPGVCEGADVRTRDSQRRDAHRLRTFSRPSGVCEMMRSALKFSWSTGVSPLASSAHEAMVTQLTRCGRKHSTFLRRCSYPACKRTR